MQKLFQKSTLFLNKYSLAIILLLGFLLRINGISFGLPFIYHPDEHFLMDPLFAIFAKGDFNPHFFHPPGSFILYSLALLQFILLSPYLIYSLLTKSVAGYGEFVQLHIVDPTLVYLVSRAIMVIFAVISLYLIYKLGEKMFNKTSGLFASFIIALTPAHIEHSRYIRYDTTATMLLLFVMLFLMKAFDSNKETRKYFFLASLFTGFAVATKFPSALIFIIIGLGCLIKDNENYHLLSKTYIIETIKIKTLLGLSLLTSFCAFFITAPFIFLDFKAAFFNIKGLLGHRVHLGADNLPWLQNNLWYMKNLFYRNTREIFFGAFGLLGLIYFFKEKLTVKKTLFICFPLIYYFTIVSGPLRWVRWMIPVLPYCTLLAGYGITIFYQRINKLSPIIKNTLSAVFILFFIISSALSVRSELIRSKIMLRQDTRTIAKYWVEQNIPQYSKIAYEHYAPHLHIDQRKDLKLLNVDWDRIMTKPLSYYKEQQVDYIIITSQFKDRVLKEDERYAVERSRYKELEQKGKLIKIFKPQDSPGPVIELYKI